MARDHLVVGSDVVAGSSQFCTNRAWIPIGRHSSICIRRRLNHFDEIIHHEAPNTTAILHIMRAVLVQVSIINFSSRIAQALILKTNQQLLRSEHIIKASTQNLDYFSERLYVFDLGSCRHIACAGGNSLTKPTQVITLA